MEEDDSIFEIYIDFKPSEGDASRVFRTMADLVDSLTELDADLASMVSISFKPELVLEEIEGGSIKAWFRAVIGDLPDEALKEASFKKILGHFLLKAKYKILKWTEEKDVIENIEEIKELEGELLVLAEETDVKFLPAYAPIKTERLLSHINSINNSLEPLIEEDKVSFISSEGTTGINSNLRISNEIIVELLTSETIETNGVRILKIKKPDFLGQSKWIFRYQEHQIEAKISDSKWLNKYQSREEDLQPGDSIKVNLNEFISYGHDGEVVHTMYEVSEVIDVIKAPKIIQGNVFGGNDF